MDAFTERLLERTRARSENLAKKMNQSQVSPRKRRPPLADTSSSENEEKKVRFQESPVKSSLTAYDIKPDTPAIPSVRSRMSKLADMRKEWSGAEGSELDSPKNVPAPKPRQPDLELNTVPSAPPSRKSRFAALAANINSWEDDLDHPKHEHHTEDKPQTRKWERPKPVEEPREEQPQPKSVTPKKPARNVRFEEEEEEKELVTGNGQGKAQIRSLPTSSPAKNRSSSTDQSDGKASARAELRSLPTGSATKGSAYSRLIEQRQVAEKTNGTSTKSGMSASGGTPGRKRIQVSLSREREPSRMELQKHFSQDQGQEPTPKPRAAAATTTSNSSTTQDQKKPSNKRQAPQPTNAMKKQAVAPAEDKKPAAVASTNVKAYFGRHKTSAAPSPAIGTTKVEPRVGAMAKSIQDRLRQHQENWQSNDINSKIQEQRKKELNIIRQRWNHSPDADKKKTEEPPTPVPRVTIVRSNPEPEDDDTEEEDTMEVTEDTINIGMVESPPSSDEEVEEEKEIVPVKKEVAAPPKQEKAVNQATKEEKGPATPLPPPKENVVTKASVQPEESGPATPLAPPRPRRTNSKVLAEEEAKAQQEALTKQESHQDDSGSDDEYDEDEDDDDDDVQEMNMTDVFGDIDDLLNEAEKAMEEEKTNAPTPAQRQTQPATLQTTAQKPPAGSVSRPQPSTSQSPNLYSIESFRKQGPKSPLPTKSIIRSDSGTVGAGHGVQPMALKPVPVKEQIQTLMEEVSAQQSVIYQTSQALNLIASNAEYRGSRQEVEAERLLLIAAQRRQACLAEIQRLKTPVVTRGPSTVQTSEGEAMKPCKGFVTVQDIRLPLRTEYILSTKQDRMNHYFFLLLRCREHVLATRIQTTVDDITGDCLPFTNVAKFNNLDSDFVIEVFVFEMQNKRPKLEEKSKHNLFSGLTPKKLLANISKDSRHGMKTPTQPSPGGPGSVRASNFSLVGATRLTLQSCRVNRFTLCKVPFNSPLEGSVHLNMSCHTNTNVKESGWLTMFDDISGFGAWHRRWCVLSGGYISFWKYPDDEKRKPPNGSIDLRRCITSEVALISRILCARPNTFELVTRQLANKNAHHGKDTLVTKHEDSTVVTKHMLSADVKEERIRWIDSLNRTLLDLRTWNRDAARPSNY